MKDDYRSRPRIEPAAVQGWRIPFPALRAEPFFSITFRREFIIMKKALFIGILLGAACTFGCATMAQQAPQVDIGNRHGNLRNAQEHIVEAWQLVGDAQYDNNSRLGGHAGRAKELLSEANEELRLAADVANEHGR
jgi:hypothetical protein